MLAVTLALRITSTSAPLERRERFVPAASYAEVHNWYVDRRPAWDEITGGSRDLAVVPAPEAGEWP